MIFLAVLFLSLGFLAAPAANAAPPQRQESPLSAAPSPRQDLGDARKLIESGNYKEALKTLEQINNQPVEEFWKDNPP